jgi:hypothetical protein
MESEVRVRRQKGFTNRYDNDAQDVSRQCEVHRRRRWIGRGRRDRSPRAIAGSPTGCATIICPGFRTCSMRSYPWWQRLLALTGICL